MLGSVFLNIQRFASGICTSHDASFSSILCDHSEDIPVLSDQNQYITYYTLIDGYGNKEIVNFIHKKFASVLFRELRKERRNNPTQTNVHLFIFSALTKVHETIERKLNKQKLPSLLTISLCCVLLVGDIIYCCNTGKSKAVLFRGGKIVDLTLKEPPSATSTSPQVKTQVFF